MKLSIIITAFHEEKTIAKAIESILNQEIKHSYELIVSAPDKPTIDIAKKYKVKIFKDPGKGKSYALNILLKKAKGEILILTDGDVFLEKDAINQITKTFNNPKIGCTAGRVKSTNNKNTLLGYWSHLLADVGAHEISRKRRAKKNKFLECSGYLFAFRNILKEFPQDVAEDTIIPYIFYKKGYKIAYAEKAIVYATNPNNLKDFIKQRKRTMGAHGRLTNYYKDFPKVKSFSNEIINGLTNFKLIFSYAKNIKEIFYTLLLFPTRLYIWISHKIDWNLKNKKYIDGWERVETAR